jgi:outer membrane receptor protein involved in Fe transport
MIRKIQPLDIDERWKALLDVENLFDKRDRRTATTTSRQISPGQPRTFAMTASARF